MKIAAALIAVALLLGGCDDPFAPPPDTQLPQLPAALRKCIEDARGVPLPDRALTVGEVERLWKTDRKTIVVQRQCGKQILAWYDTLRKGWR